MKWVHRSKDRPWHLWFAWHPVHVWSVNATIWWEWVERKTDDVQGLTVHRYREVGSL